MNIDDYESKLNNLYDLLKKKIENKKNEKLNEDNLEDNKYLKKINDLEEENAFIKTKYNDIELKYNILESKYDLLEKNYNKIKTNIDLMNSKLEKNVFYTNLLYIPHLNDDKGLESLIFKDKFSMITNTKYRKRYIQNKIMKGSLNLNDLKNKKLIIDTKTYLKNDINFIMLTLYNKELLINNYNFNYMLKVKKINDYKIEVLDKYDSKLLLSMVDDKKVFYNEIKVFYFRIDELYNIISS